MLTSAAIAHNTAVLRRTEHKTERGPIIPKPRASESSPLQRQPRWYSGIPSVPVWLSGFDCGRLGLQLMKVDKRRLSRNKTLEFLSILYPSACFVTSVVCCLCEVRETWFGRTGVERKDMSQCLAAALETNNHPEIVEIPDSNSYNLLR
jgi:hypothetical protein